jgi:hypothetical protein
LPWPAGLLLRAWISCQMTKRLRCFHPATGCGAATTRTPSVSSRQGSDRRRTNAEIPGATGSEPFGGDSSGDSDPTARRSSLAPLLCGRSVSRCWVGRVSLLRADPRALRPSGASAPCRSSRNLIRGAVVAYVFRRGVSGHAHHRSTPTRAGPRRVRPRSRRCAPRSPWGLAHARGCIQRDRVRATREGAPVVATDI